MDTAPTNETKAVGGGYTLEDGSHQRKHYHLVSGGTGMYVPIERGGERDQHNLSTFYLNAVSIFSCFASFPASFLA
jgi:hypothetical protein